MTDKDLAIFDAIQQTPNLRSGLVDTMIAQIEAGDLAPGQRLPTEQAIMAATGVSRTVVREALASLRAKGLITTRQGLGAFVSMNPNPKSFSIVPTDVESIDEVIDILELRIGIETEAAGLAALRRSDDDLTLMKARLTAIDASISAGDPGTQEDFAFHRAVLVATGNSHYARLFDTYGSVMVPRHWVRFDEISPLEREAHAARMRREHHAIFAAIRDSNENGARRALRRHLQRSVARFVALRDKAEEKQG